MDNTNDKHEKKSDNNTIDTASSEDLHDDSTDTDNNDNKDFDLPDAPEWISRKWQEEHYEEIHSPAPRKVYKKKKNYNRLITLIIILLMIISGFIYYLCTSDNEDTTPTVASQQSNSLNIMIMGVDRRADDVGRSDTLMVLT